MPRACLVESEGEGGAPLRAAGAREWAERRWQRLAAEARIAKAAGWTDAHRAPAYSLSALERYQDCPFKFFAADVLRLEEAPEDESTLSPRARGRFIHEVFQRFFEAWDARGAGRDHARVAGRGPRADRPQWPSRCSPACPRPTRRSSGRGSSGPRSRPASSTSCSASKRRTPLVVLSSAGSSIASKGEFALGSADGRRVPLNGVADRIDLLDGNRLRVIDYKTGSAPNVKRALQVPIYALCAQERQAASDGQAWTIDEAAYIAFSGKQVVCAGGQGRCRRRRGVVSSTRATLRGGRRDRARRVSAAPARSDHLHLVRLRDGLPEGLRGP